MTSTIIRNLATKFTEAIISEHFRVREVQNLFGTCLHCYEPYPHHKLMYYEEVDEGIVTYGDLKCNNCSSIEDFCYECDYDPDEYTTVQNTYQNKLKEEGYIPPFSGSRNECGAHCMLCYNSINNHVLLNEDDPEKSPVYYDTDKDINDYFIIKYIRYTCDTCIMRRHWRTLRVFTMNR